MRFVRLLPALMFLVGLLAFGCEAGPVSVQPPTPAGAQAPVCRDLEQRLPQRIERQDRRPTEPNSPLLTAWGSPPIVVRCGVGPPGGLRPTSPLFSVNGVLWLPEPPRNPVRFTTVRRQPRVEVSVPEEYAPAGNVLVELAAPIRRTIPKQPAIEDPHDG